MTKRATEWAEKDLTTATGLADALEGLGKRINQPVIAGAGAVLRAFADTIRAEKAARRDFQRKVIRLMDGSCAENFKEMTDDQLVDTLRWHMMDLAGDL